MVLADEKLHVGPDIGGPVLRREALVFLAEGLDEVVNDGRRPGRAAVAL
jgi:hypothetical protein